MQFLKLNLLIAFLFMAISVIAQGDFSNGSIVTNSNDTIRGFVDNIRNNYISTNCIFKKNIDAEVVKYKPFELKGFSFDGGKRYITRQVVYHDSTYTFFFEHLVKGIVSLYYCKYLNDEIYYVEKDNIMYQLLNDQNKVKINDKMYYHNNRKYIGVLTLLMSDAGLFVDKIQTVNFDTPSLVRLLKDYHNVMNNNQKLEVLYKKGNKVNDINWKVRFGVSMEYSLNNMISNGGIVPHAKSITFSLASKNKYITESFAQFDTLYSNAIFNEDYNCLFPVLFLNFNRNSGNSLQLELKYRYMKYSYLSFSRIEIPLMYYYDFFHYHKVKPFINVGVSNLITFGTKFKELRFDYNKLDHVYLQNETIQSVYTSVTDYARYASMTAYHVGLNIGAGVAFVLPDRSALKLEFRIQTPMKYLIEGNLDGGADYEMEYKDNSLSLSLSYMFK